MRKMREKLGNIARQNAEFARALLAALLVVLLVSQTVPTEALATGMETIAEGVSTTLDQPEEGDGDEATGGEEPAPGEETGEAAPDDATSTEEAPGTSDSSSIPAEEPAEGEDIPESSATYAADDELVLVTVQGAASASEDAAAAALVDDAGLDDKTARATAAALFAAPIADPLPAQGDEGSDLPFEGDGSFVNNISVRWMTADSTVPSDAADGVQAIADEESVLYQCPSSNASQSVRMRVSYALSGEHNYEAGDVTITIPANIFTNRDGKAEGRMRLSMPENPDTSAEWNYQLVDGSYVITNTRPMSAATQGYMEFLIEDLRPSDLVDMAESAPFNATIEVVTHAGNLIGLKSDDITARFDTHAEIQSATKRQSGAVRRVPASEIPVNQRIPDEEEYVIVSWYMNAYVPLDITQAYELTLRDTVGTVLVEGKESNIKGFLIDETGEDETGASYKDEEVFNGYSYGTSKYTYVEVAYPFSAFEKETDYTFQNSVEYTLAEKDPDVAASDGTDVIDAQEVTTALAKSTVDWYFEDPVFVEPRGHFNVFKYGNSSTPSGDGMETISPTYYTSYSDLRDTSWPGYSPWNGYFGSYPSALNDLRDGEDTTISYTINTVGFLLPWTYKEVESPEGGNPLGILENYGQRSVTMTTEDTGLRVGDTKLELGSDYVYQSVEFPKRPDIMKATAINLNEDGSVSFDSADDGTVDYEVDEDHTKTPDVTLQIKRDGGDWETWATASWSNGENGELSLTPASGAQIDPNNEAKVLLPEGTTAVRTQVSAKNAAVLYHIRVNATLLGDGAMGTMTKDSFEGTANPSLNVWNGTTMTAVQDDTQSPIVVIDKEGYDTLRGYTTDTRVLAEKSARSDTDYENKIATVHYSAKVRNQTFITDETVFEEALANGEVQAERGGTWYDLLPRGMVPKLDTVKLRDGDAIREMYTLENYRGSGRTLLVVSADLTPVPTEYSVEELDYYEDVITIEFDATYNAESFLDYGNETHNVIAYRSDNEQIGTVEGYRGENNPNGSNNNGTAGAFADGDEGAEEKELLSTLVEERESNNFLYAGADYTLDSLELGRTGLNKTVMVNNDGRWSSGLEYGDESEARDVYVSGLYSYRLGFGSGLDTKTSDIILYDSLENYEPTDDNNNGIDTGKPRWQGTFAGIDLTSLEEMGCAPVVYYSTQKDLVLEEGGVGSKPSGDQVVPDKDMIDLSNSNVWQLLTDEVNPSDVKAIAVDATKRADGTPFVLDSEQSCSVIVHMRAPQGNAASEHVKQDAHAFNNIYMAATTQDIKEGSQPAENFIRQDYTKVGLVAYGLSVSKTWDDAENQDGKRPGSVTVDLYANGKPVTDAFPNWTGISTSLTLSDENGWKGTFGNLPLYDDYGSKIVYSLVESNVEGYVSDIRFDGDASFTITNRHEPEKVDVSGTKTWVGDTEGVRPASVKVDLYADGEYVKSQTVRADVDGNWSYAFTGLDKYKPVGQEIEYTVKEDVTSAPSYTPSVDGTDITNTYHPYGDLVITKQTTGTSAGSADKDFSFTLQFTRVTEDGQTEEPILDSFEYVVYDANGDKVDEGAVATNGTITLKAGQRAEISEIPEYARYKVTEADVPGFTQSSTGETGIIEPNEEQVAAFTNAYEAAGYLNLGARKTLTGHDLSARQFNFELVDQDGNVVRVASNAAPDDEGVDRDGNKVESAPVTFGALTYTQADHGKPFTYTIHEYVSDAAGYTYDKATYTVTVKPTDNGDGTMSFDVTYADEDGNPVEAGNVSFENTYVATGSLTLNAYKTLTGGDLAEGAFTFELGEVVKADDGTVSFNKLQDNATNDKSGRVTFEPLTYDQTDVGKSLIYAIHETAGDNAAIEYDGHWGYVRATVSDNGNGTLSVATEFSGFDAPCVACKGTGTLADGESCPDCGGNGSVSVTAESIDFVNRYVDGNLDIKKTVEGDTTGADPNQLFTFRVELVNEEGQSLEGVSADDVTFEALGSQAAGTTTPEDPNGGDGAVASADDVTFEALGSQAAGTTTPEDPNGGDETAASASTLPVASSAPEEASEPQSWVDSALDAVGKALCWVFGVETAYAETITENEGSWEWTLDTNTGELSISGTDIGGWSGSQRNSAPWYGKRTSIKKVSFAEGSTASGSLAGCFFGCNKLAQIDWANLDTSGVTSMYSMFYGCSSLASIDLSTFKTSSVTDMREMFLGCSSLESLELPESFDTSNVEYMSSMFSDCFSLKSLELPESFKTSSVTSMSSMFADCSSLKSLELPESFKTSSVKSMSAMFYGCSSLESLELPESFDTSNVESMASMFSGCSSLESLELPESFDTFRVTDMDYMFYGCSSLKSLELPESFNTSSVTVMYYMFSGCSSLESLELPESFDTSSVTAMFYMFSGCSSLESLELPESFNTSRVTNMSIMFSGCSSLKSLELPESFDTSSVRQMSSMFSDCSSLKSLELPESFDTSSVEYMSSMFDGCSSLTSLELPESFKTSSVTSMSAMFDGCDSLESLELPESFDTSNVESMDAMFRDCSSLKSLELPESFKTSSVKSMSSMFYGCSSLESLELPESFDTSGVTSMRGMFYRCFSLASLELPKSFKTSSVTDMREMFGYCFSLESLDLSSFDTSSVKNMGYMFDSCSQLSRVTLGNNFEWVGTNGYLPDCEQFGADPIGWIRIDDTGLPAAGASELSGTELGEQYPTCGVGTYVWNTFIDIHFDGNGATGSMADQKINGHVASTLNTMGTSFTHSGSVFAGWNTVSDGSGLSFADGATIEADAFKDYVAKHEVTLYAQWQTVSSVTMPSEGVLEITMPADYVAHLKGLPSGTSYRVYEKTPEGWTLVESTGTTGVIKPNESQEAAFVNKHTPDVKSATAQIFATKTLDGMLASENSGFSFTLSATDGSPDHDTFESQTKGVSAGGNVVFDPITYTTAGTYHYVISEIAGSDNNINYDGTEELVTVEVEEDDGGRLSATVSYDNNDADPDMASFANTTKSGSLSITKKAVGDDGNLTDAVEGVEFTFLLTVNGSPYSGAYAVGDETKNTSDGTISLKASETAKISDLKRGDSYAVTEVEVPAGWTAGAEPGNATGTIAAGQAVALEFTNTYAASGQAQLMAYKELPGASLAAGQYEFALYEGDSPAEDAEPVKTVSNGAVDGTEFLPDEVTGEPTTEPNPTYGMAPAYFSPLEYTLKDVGTHVYTIREVVPEDEDKIPGIVYDESAWTATVTVTDNGDGTLSTAVTYAKDGQSEDYAVFTNTLQSTGLRVEKRVKDIDSLSEAARQNLTFEFTISLKDASGESLGQKITGTVYDAANDAPVEPEVTVAVSDGESFLLEAGQYVLFKDVPYGTVYEVTETERPGWSQVAEETTGTSGTTASDSGETASAVFVNAYSASGEATLEAAKTFEGKLPEEGEFTFLLYDVTGLDEGAEPDLAQQLQRVGNGADGMVRFAPIEYTAADDGKTFTYEIRELQGTEEDIRYDETVVTAKVVVTDKGDGTMGAAVTYFVDGEEISEDWYTFQNWLTVTLARTGGPGAWAAGVGTVVVALGCLAYLRRKRGWTLRHAKHARR